MAVMSRSESSSAAPAATQLEALRARDRWPRARLEVFQHERLRELIEHAVSASPYYREVLGADALDPDVRLEDLPTLSKATLVEQFDRVVTDPRLCLAEVEAHAGGPDPAALLHGAYHVFTTSGTTGRRGVFPQTLVEFRQWLDLAARAVWRNGISSAARPIGIPAPTPPHITQKLFA